MSWQRWLETGAFGAEPAYNAILQLLTLIVRSRGYRVAGAGHHARTIQVAGVLEDRLTGEELGYFDLCRRKRNLADYDAAGRISEAEAARIVSIAERLRGRVVKWAAGRSDPRQSRES